MNLERYSPRGIAERQLVRPLEIPSDLKLLINQLFDIPRYVNTKYPPGIFVDDVGLHTIRLVNMAGTVEVTGMDQEKLERTLWIHDIPELVIGEYIAPVKDGDTELAQKLAIEEKAAAVKLLKPSDVQLLADFNNTSTSEGWLAMVLDKTDGSMFYHWSLVKHIRAGGNPGTLGATGMVYAFTQRQKFLQSLEAVKARWPEVADVCTNLLNYQIEFIARAWKQVPARRTPRLIREHLKKIAFA
jgi:5'-deoxynucleotidase YfbR-like HD superfamily hydrolase